MARGVKPVDAGVVVGQVLEGKYRVDSIIGHGGMGVVAECTHLDLNERVAIKMLRQDVLLDNDAVQRFMREAQAAVKLKSEYVARVSDVGKFANGVPYMVMEYLDGNDIGQLLEQRGVLPVPWATELVLQTCEALQEAHSLNIVHRDVKPTNLFVTWRPDGSAIVKVLDFGISKSPMGTDMQLTQTQSLLGTPAYMSPEQMRSARLVDSRTDIWSLGTVFYEIVEGRRPFEAESFSEMCVKVAVDPPAPMHNAPPALQHVILRCLAKTPEQRYSSMAELGADLVPFTQNPQQAQHLVERMNRLVRRMHPGWNDESSARTPSRADRSQPVMRVATPQPWSSDPHGSPWSSKSEPFAVPLPRGRSPGPQTLSGSKEDLYDGVNTISQRKQRRWPLVAGVAVLATVGLVIGIVVSGGAERAEDAPKADVVAPDNKAPDKAPDTKAAVETKPDTKAAVEKAPDLAAEGSAKPPDKVPDKAPDLAGAGSAKPPDKAPDKPAGKTELVKADGNRVKHSGSTGPKPNTTSKGAGAAPPTSTGTGKPTPPAKETTDATVKTAPEPPKPKCDPFNAMHGCADSKPPTN